MRTKTIKALITVVSILIGLPLHAQNAKSLVEMATNKLPGVNNNSVQTGAIHDPNLSLHWGGDQLSAVNVVHKMNSSGPLIDQTTPYLNASAGDSNKKTSGSRLGGQ